MDIDRLHKVINKEITGRRVGKTTAKLSELIGYLHLKDELELKYIFCIVSVRRDFGYISALLYPLLDENRLYVEKETKTIPELIINGVKVRFITETEMECKLRGYDNYAVIWMRRDD